MACKTKRKKLSVPKFFKVTWLRYLWLALALLTIIFVNITVKQLPVLPVLFALGIILTIFYQPVFWHRYLCPYGTILSIFSRFNKFTNKV